jgi:hypothetical protein
MGVKFSPDSTKIYAPVAIVKRSCPKVFVLFDAFDSKSANPPNLGIFRFADLNPIVDGLEGEVFFDVVLVSMSAEELPDWIANQSAIL